MLIHNFDQYSDDWWAIRLGKPTASVASQLVTSTGALSKSLPELAAVLAADLYAGVPVDAFKGNVYTERGSDLEPEARETYQFITGHDVMEVGFITDDLLRWGASPDGLVGDDGLAEIKCKIAKEHVKALAYWNKNKRPPPAHVAQCQMQMFVAERAWCDLFLYNPELPSLRIRVKADPEFHKVLKSQLIAVLAARDEFVKMLEAM